jgi:quercetin dioxygenase-like cupin family protein
VIVIEGTGEALAGDVRGAVSPGALVVVPAFARHTFENTGSDMLKLVGFFPTGAIITEFDEPLAPLAVKTLVTPILEQ